MPTSIDQVLPSLAALGVLAYWVIGLASGLEAFVLTGIFLPGTVLVDAGGFMVQRGLLDFFDLVWFVAIGSVLGGEATFWTARHLRRGMAQRWKVEEMAAFQRARHLFERHGGLAVILGRFLGPVAAFVPLAAALSGMEPRRFRLWNLASGLPYALTHVGLGYLIGAGLTRLSPVLTRELLFALGLAVAALVLWWVLRRLDKAVPALLALLAELMDQVAQHPHADSLGARYPRLGRFLAARMDRSHVKGLPGTLLVLGFGYLLTLWIGLAFDMVQADPIVQIDARLAEMMHLFWTPVLLRAFTTLTALGDTRVVAALLVLALLWLWLSRNLALMTGLLAALGLDLLSVWSLKSTFGRPRSDLGYFLEISGSFPSGHAAIGVAFYGMLFYLLWRLRRLGPVSAAFLAGMTAFLIGLSRLFLVEHYLSDVLAGWILGGLCLLSGIALAEWRLSLHLPRAVPVSGARAVMAGLISLALLGGVGLRLHDYTRVRNPVPIGPAPMVLARPEALFADPAVPSRAETLTGEHRLALNIAFLASTPEALIGALEAQGWTRARPASLGGLVQTALGDLRGEKQPDAALAPLFWNTLANDLALSGPAVAQGDDVARLRLWQAPYATVDGKRLWLGVASRDDGLDPEPGAAAPDLAATLAGALGAARGAGLTPAGQPAIPLVTLD